MIPYHVHTTARIIWDERIREAELHRKYTSIARPYKIDRLNPLVSLWSSIARRVPAKGEARQIVRHA
jgi:hypothetical protein